MRLLVYLSVALAVAYFLFFSDPSVELGAGVMAPDDPIQKKTRKKPFDFQNFTVTPQASFDITAKVIAKKNYSDAGATLSPTDLAMGWGRMSDEEVLSKINFSQSGRWYRYNYKQPPIPQKEIQTHSANMHIIPATEYVKKMLNKVKRGQIISIQGKLVSVEHKETDWRWKSSLTRNDTGGGSCELIFAEEIMIMQGQ